MMDKPLPEELRQMLAKVRYSIEATHLERMALRDMYKSLKWESTCFGGSRVVGTLAGHPVMFSFFIDIIDGHPVVFYEATSQVVDYRMIDAWLDEHLPNVVNRGPAGRTRALSFDQCVKALDQLTRAAAGAKEALEVTERGAV